MPKHGGGSVTFTTAQGADKALEAVSEELDRLPASFSKYLAPSAGTYNCRAIAGTERMSMHAYAAAIDINTKQTTYWQWVKPGADGLYHWSNKIPPEIVAAFERHGFIWGGRWYHFDTMHFEYRPELLPRRELYQHRVATDWAGPSEAGFEDRVEALPSRDAAPAGIGPTRRRVPGASITSSGKPGRGDEALGVVGLGGDERQAAFLGDLIEKMRHAQ